jgi:hypothetical protein
VATERCQPDNDTAATQRQHPNWQRRLRGNLTGLRNTDNSGKRPNCVSDII